MKRIDIIFNKLQELNDPKGVSAKYIADTLGLARSNVSRDLNTLTNNNRVVKIKGKPVLFRIAKSKVKSTLEHVAEHNTALRSIVDKAITAVLYPPNGMNMLLLGEDSVEMSMFAELIYKYTIEVNLKEVDTPFIMFNCADYLNNAPLLFSLLFGKKKDDFTVTDKDTPGLVDKANKGILFLDNIHQLPTETQETILTFMEKGVYCRLGETDTERKADVLIISATTISKADSSFITELANHIPMVIDIPNLTACALTEHSQLSHYFFEEKTS